MFWDYFANSRRVRLHGLMNWRAIREWIRYGNPPGFDWRMVLILGAVLALWKLADYIG